MSTPTRRLNPFSAVIKDRYPLTKDGSSKTTYHIVLSNPGLTFKVGDSIGIFAKNDPVLVEKFINALNVAPETPVIHPRTAETMSLATFLSAKANLSRLSTASLEECLKSFAPLLPRFYSVASSLLSHPDEIHLTVALSTYIQDNELHYGVASHFLCHLAEVEQTSIPCYVQPAPHFTLPPSDETHIIMVGPGTGVAPFRGFLQERLHKNAPGRNWLFFGERHRAHDFFYEEFWNTLVAQDKLSLDLAFSRDQADKIYVQHRLLEKGAAVWTWLQEGAYFYVCGDADPMAKEVEAALLQICQTHGGLDITAAQAYIKQLRHNKRYLVDVY